MNGSQTHRDGYFTPRTAAVSSTHGTSFDIRAGGGTLKQSGLPTISPGNQMRDVLASDRISMNAAPLSVGHDPFSHGSLHSLKPNMF